MQRMNKEMLYKSKDDLITSDCPPLVRSCSERLFQKPALKTLFKM